MSQHQKVKGCLIYSIKSKIITSCLKEKEERKKTINRILQVIAHLPNNNNTQVCDSTLYKDEDMGNNYFDVLAPGHRN